MVVQAVGGDEVFHCVNSGILTMHHKDQVSLKGEDVNSAPDYRQFLSVWDRRLNAFSDKPRCRESFRSSFESWEQKLRKDLPPDLFAHMVEVAQTDEVDLYFQLGSEIGEYLRDNGWPHWS